MFELLFDECADKEPAVVVSLVQVVLNGHVPDHTRVHESLRLQFGFQEFIQRTLFRQTERKKKFD